MKVLLFIDNMGSGGAQRQIMTLVGLMKKDGMDAEIAWYYNSEFYLREIEGLGISYHRIYEKSYFKRLVAFQKLMLNEKYDWVIAYLPGPSVISSLLKTFHGYSLIVNERSANPLAQKSIKTWFYRLFYTVANYVCTNSFENMKQINQANFLLSKKKTRVIYNSLNLMEWTPFAEISDPDKFCLIVLSSHRRLKNLAGLIEAINGLDDHFLGKLRVEWYGDDSKDGSKEEGIKLINQYSLNEVIQLHPARKNVKPLIIKANAIGLFSHYEGLPNAVCEGMACGKPIIATRVSDLPIILRHQDHLLCDSHKIDSIGSVLENALKLTGGELSNIGEENRMKAEQLFSSERNFDLLKDLLKGT